MQMMRQARRILKRALLGPTEPAQKFHIGLPGPQARVDVWLEGWGNRIDVTHRHFLACGAPLTIGIGFEPGETEAAKTYSWLTLQFREHAGAQRVLGEIGLRVDSSFRVDTREVYLFQATGYRNNCMPWIRLQMHYILYERMRRQSKDDVRITRSDSRAMIVFYLCPRPIGLVTVGDVRHGNLFPMNLMGSIGGDYFAFALNKNRAAPLVQRAGVIVLSTVPLDREPVVSSLGKNHRKTSIDWGELPFSTIHPRNIDAPVPSFALSACKMRIEEFRDLGSHTLFVARRLAEERFVDGPQLFLAHGMYKAWLLRERGTIDSDLNSGTTGQRELASSTLGT
jgi:flavin reductase (DIM6/NTAB) family NADH-FMN oxidoreductase RutF